MDYPGRSYGQGTRRGNYTKGANNYNYDRPSANNRFDHDSYNHFSHGNTQGSWNTGRPSFISGVNPHSFNDAIRHNSNVSRDQHTGSDQRHSNNSGSYMHENYDQGAGNFAPNSPRRHRRGGYPLILLTMNYRTLSYRIIQLQMTTGLRGLMPPSILLELSKVKPIELPFLKPKLRG